MTRVHPEDGNLPGQVDKHATTVCPLCLESHSFIVYLEILVALIITDGNRERGQQS